MAFFWNPWRGCHKVSEGCQYCYIHKGDQKSGVDTNIIVKTANFVAPILRLKNGNYKWPSGNLVYLCFSSDFLLEDADIYRRECLAMIKERADLTFLFLTKRIERYAECFKGYLDLENIIVGCTVENQKQAEKRLAIFNELPIKHKDIICQPLIEDIDLTGYLKDIELVVVGGESDKNARPLDFNWVLNIRKQCINNNVSFEFRQCGTYTIKDGVMHHLKTFELMSQARSANVNWLSSKNT